MHSSAKPSIDSVVSGELNASSADVWARDPESFLAGEPHRHPAIWDTLTLSHPQRDLILGWIKHGISVKEFIVPFKGQYRQERFNHLFPPNNKKCKFYRDTISREIEQKIAMGVIKVWGRVGTCQPPAIVMPLSIEPSKPRLVHYQQYLNCFMRHCPFSLDQVVNLPRYLQWATKVVETLLGNDAFRYLSICSILFASSVNSLIPPAPQFNVV